MTAFAAVLLSDLHFVLVWVNKTLMQVTVLICMNL